MLNSIFKLKAAPVVGKNSVNDAGWIEGYAAVWNFIDLDNEIFVRGAFSQSIRSVIPARTAKLMVKHFRDGADSGELIGTITDAREDEYGLWIHAELSSTQQAQEIRKLVLEGHVNTLSVGFAIVDFDYRTVSPGADRAPVEVRAITKAVLFETTVTIRPANPRALITGAKAVGTYSQQIKAELLREKAYLEGVNDSLKTDSDWIAEIEELIRKGNELTRTHEQRMRR